MAKKTKLPSSGGINWKSRLGPAAVSAMLAACAAQTPPLVEAAQTGDLARVNQLLDAGADPNIANDNHETVLDVAASTHSATYELLRRHGARYSWI